MKESTNKEKIFKSIREALLNNSNKDLSGTISPSDFYKSTSDEDLSIAFAESFSNSGNSFFYCSNEQTFKRKLNELFLHAPDKIACYSSSFLNFVESLHLQNIFLAKAIHSHPIGILLCENLIASDGSIIFTEKQGLKNSMTSFPETCIVIAFTSQVSYSLKSALMQIKTRYVNDFPSLVLTLGSNCTKENEIKSLSVLLIEDQQVNEVGSNT